jgi:23S rRNA pseudouridine2605 synthase
MVQDCQKPNLITKTLNILRSQISCMDERLQKVLSRWGVASRRQTEQMILAGRVCVNSTTAYLGQKIDPHVDQVLVDGIAIQTKNCPERVYLLMNKPVGVVCTCTDPQGRTTVLDLLGESFQNGLGIHPVGRLDADSTGALLLTNDGNLTFYMTHPRHLISKTYRVWVEGAVSDKVLMQWRDGVELEGRQTLPAELSVVRRQAHHKTLLEIKLREGRNRQIRRVAEQLGHPVLQLHRIAIGAIELQPSGAPVLASGAYRLLTKAEICFLTSQIDLTSIREPMKEGECIV